MNKIPESAFICEEPPQQHYLDSGVEVTNKLGTYFWIKLIYITNMYVGSNPGCSTVG